LLLKDTLASTIAYLDKKTQLTIVSIAETEKDLQVLEEEIEDLSGKIGRLDGSLEKISHLLLSRIIETYKKGKIDPLYLFLSSDGFSQFMTRYKYLKKIQEHDRSLLYQIEQTRFNYDSQKNLKEEMQEKAEILKTQLERQKLTLAQEKKNKSVLLNETKGKETEYQKILNRLLAQMAELTGVVSECPAELKIWTEENNYFNQTDKRWAYYSINFITDSSLCRYGCAVTSMAMVLKKSGVDVNPQTLASQSIYSTDLMAWQYIPSIYGGSITIKGHYYGGSPDWQVIDEKLNQDKWVIVYISGAGHYVVLLNKQGDDYLMHDPYFGSKLSFNEYYSQSAVDQMIIYEK